MDQEFTISPSQGVMLMEISELLKHGENEIRSDGEDAENAMKALHDIAQEIALQVGT